MTTVLLLTIMALSCGCTLCTSSFVVFAKSKRDLDNDIAEANTLLDGIYKDIKSINGDKPPKITAEKKPIVLAKPQDTTPRTGIFKVAGGGCLGANDAEVYYTPDETQCASGLQVQPLSPFDINIEYVAPPAGRAPVGPRAAPVKPQTTVQSKRIGNGFVIRLGEKYVTRDFKLVAHDKAAPVRLVKSSAGVIEAIPTTLEDASRNAIKNGEGLPCWAVDGGKLREKWDRMKRSDITRASPGVGCATWQTP